MTAAPHPGDRDELLELLADRYPGAVALGLLPLCGPRCDIHHGAPCTSPGKRPLASGWTAEAAARWADPDADADRWRARMADHAARGGNLGWCPPPGTLAIDADTPASVDYCDRAMPDAPMQGTASGAHYVGRLPAGVTLPARCGVELAPGITVDLRPGGAAQIAVEPSIHASGTAYAWRRQIPADLGDLPEIPAGLLAAIQGPRSESRTDPGGATDGDAIPAGRRNATLASLAGTMRRRGMSADEIEAALGAVNARRCRPPLDDAEVAEIARSVGRYRPGGAATAIGEDRSASDAEDVANAHRLARHHGDELRWCASRGWLAYTGSVWEETETGAIAIASRLGRIVHAEAAELAAAAARAESETERERAGKAAEALMRWARASEAAKRVRAALDLARPLLEIRDAALDADPYALGCANGVVDLRTGELRPHRASDYLTRCTGVAYDPEARDELWDRVLAEALPEAPLRDYLRRCAGYTALGITGEDVLLLVHGPTRTSKGTIQGAIAAALGSYAMTAGLETFAARRHADGARARPELIRLRGARMVSVYETGRALRLDAPLVKSLAGSDSITARALYREEVEFQPACTLWLATNHRPIVDDDDDALWERMREIPFRAHVAPERRDPTVRARLADPVECGPAVLAWIVRGALDYQRDGLGQPDAVRSATSDYRSAMDPLAEYLIECAVLDPRAWVATSALREDYERWCRERGERPMPATRWGESLRRHGCEPRKVGTRRGWDGIGLRAAAHEED